MTTVSEKDKQLAALALFSNLYDTHKSINDVILAFVKMGIMKHGELTLRPLDVQGYLLEDFGFNIPLSVIQQVMRKADFLTRDTKTKDFYYVSSQSFKRDSDEFEATINEVKSEIDTVILALREHLHNVKFSGATAISDFHLKKALCAFLLESSHESKLSTLIEQFVLLNPDYRPILQKVIVGSIIFLGLSYNTSSKEYATLTRPLTIYLDTEILFYAAGLDGLTLKKIFDEFYETVGQINNLHYQREGKKLIHLKYFPEIAKEIDDYFAAAIKIRKGVSILDASRTAMATIVQNSKTESDVIRYKAHFWKIIKDYDISLETYDDYYRESNKPFNIESEDFIKQISVNGLNNDEDNFTNLRYLNYVNIRRASRSQKQFSEIGYIFVTQTGAAFKLDRTIANSYGNERFPLVSSIHELSARLWLGLNKGFNPQMNLTSWDVIVKAQIGLSNKVTKALEQKHRELQQKLNGSHEDDIAAQLAALREYVPHLPEEMTSSSEIVQKASNIEQFVDDKILEVQHKDAVLKQQQAQMKQMEEDHLKTIKDKDAQLDSLQGALNKQAHRNLLTSITSWKNGRNKRIRKVAYIYMGIAWLEVISCIFFLSMSVNQFIGDNTKAGIGCIITGILLLSIRSIVDFIKEKKVYLKYIWFPKSDLNRLLSFKKKLEKYIKEKPRPTLGEEVRKLLPDNS